MSSHFCRGCYIAFFILMSGFGGIAMAQPYSDETQAERDARMEWWRERAVRHVHSLGRLFGAGR